MLRLIPIAALLVLTAYATAAQPEQPLNFINDIVPIFTKAGCNSGACHAKAGMGQRGFRLSLLGFEPDEDYEHIVKEGRGRRLFPAAPEESLLITKATNATPHGGGKKIEPKSEDYQTLVRWVQQGVPYTSAKAPSITRISVEPALVTQQRNSTFSLTVTAHYSDHSIRNVTHHALFEANDRAMAEADEAGKVKVMDLPGTVAIMVRYSGQVAVCNVAIPLGAPVPHLPKANNFIDQLVFANLQKLGIPPSPIIDDASFLRRVTLDIAGRLPTVEELQRFIANPSASKRETAIDDLLCSPDYADYFANKWTSLLKNKRDDTADITANFAFHAWMRDSLLANTPYDQIVRQILASTGTIVANPPVAWYKRVKDPNVQLEDVAQLFLGVRMQCAQCHHHPFERWSQAEYYSLAAFFSQVGRKPTAIAGEDLIFHKRGIAQTEHRKTRVMLRPAGLGEPPLDIAPDDDPRLALVDWMSKPSNPFFARALVNRYWKHFFKRGLIEPEDDIRDTNPASNSELLDALAKHFTDSRYDLKSLVRIIVQSHAYQLSSEPNEHNSIDRQNYSRFYPRRMSAEVLLDNIDMVCGSKSDFADLPPGTRAISLPDNSYNRASAFLKVFGRPEASSVCECERVSSPSLSQSLHLMNASDVRSKLSASGGRADTLLRTDQSDPKRIRDIYLAALARQPDATELRTAERHVLNPIRTKRQNYEDLLWALLNTKEFLFNH